MWSVNKPLTQFFKWEGPSPSGAAVKSDSYLQLAGLAREASVEAQGGRVMQKQCPSAKSLIFLLQHKTCRSTGHPDNPAAPPLRTRRLRIKVTLSKHFLPHSLANKDPVPPQIQNTVIINGWQLRLHRNFKRKKMLKCMQIGCLGSTFLLRGLHCTRSR